MKRLHLTCNLKVLSDKGKDFIEKFTNATEKTIDGKNREWFEEMNIKVPDELLEEDEYEIDAEGNLLLNEEHFKEEKAKVTIPLKNIDSFMQDGENTLLYTKSGMYYNVSETVEEINLIIDSQTHKKL